MIDKDIDMLNRAFQLFNKELFNGELEEVAITIQSSNKCYAYITTSKVWKKNDKKLYEINLAAEYLDRDIIYVLSSLLHEMTHLSNMIHGRRDTSNGTRYHNQVFRREAERVGLIVNYDKSIGWSITTPSPKLIQLIHDNGFTNIDHARITKNAEGNRIKKPSSTRTYACPNCSCSVRCTRDWFLICGTCMETMVKIK